MPPELSKANDIILLQAWYIMLLDDAFHELVGVVAKQYDQIHKPKRKRGVKTSKSTT